MLLFKALIALISSPLACVQLRGPGAVGCPQPGNQEELHPWGGAGGCGEKRSCCYCGMKGATALMSREFPVSSLSVLTFITINYSPGSEFTFGAGSDGGGQTLLLFPYSSGIHRSPGCSSALTASHPGDGTGLNWWRGDSSILHPISSHQLLWDRG